MVYDLIMSREDPQMKIRLPADLKRKIEEAADEAKRTMNAEIVSRLEASFLRSGEGLGEASILLMRAQQELERSMAEINQTIPDIADRVVELIQRRSDQGRKS